MRDINPDNQSARFITAQTPKPRGSIFNWAVFNSVSKKNRPKKRNHQLAFTLIELLLVISIMSLLSSVAFAAVKKARPKSRDIRRTLDLHNMYTALMLYYNNHGKFPCHSEGNTSYDDDNFLKPLVDDNLIAKFPVDPLNTDYYKYVYFTFHTPTNATCGQYAFLSGYTETPPAICPDGGQWSDDDQHCHNVLPNGLPLPCLNPYYLDQNLGKSGNNSCRSWRDTVNDY